MRGTTSTMLIVIASLISSCAQKSIGPTSFSPLYKSQLDAEDVVVVRQCAAVSRLNVSHDLKGRVVGKRTLESRTAPPQNITIEGDLPAWIKASAQTMFQKASLKTGVANAPSLTLTLHELQINENVYVNAGYNARVILDASVFSTDGKECWTARKTGFAQNYGKHGSAEAYRETADHALDRAIMSIAADASFQEALCATCRR